MLKPEQIKAIIEADPKETNYHLSRRLGIKSASSVAAIRCNYIANKSLKVSKEAHDLVEDIKSGNLKIIVRK